MMGYSKIERIELVCLWIAELVTLPATLFSLIYGLKHFFKREALFLQSITITLLKCAV